MNISLRRSFQLEMLLLAVLMAASGVWAVALGRDNNWDLYDYHFYNGFAALHHRYFHDMMAAEVQTFLNPFFDIINYEMIMRLPPVVTVFLLGTLSGVYAFLLYKTAMLLLADVPERLRLAYAAFAVAVGATGAGGISVLGLTTNDNKMAVMVMAALYCIVKAMLHPPGKMRTRLTIAAGMIIGLVTGFKMVAGFYAIGFGLGLFCSDRLSGRHLRLCAAFAAAALIGFLLADGFWMTFLYRHFRNPFFPYYNNIFRTPYAQIGENYKDLTYQPKHLFTLPFYFAFKADTFPAHMIDLRPLLLYILAIALLIKKALGGGNPLSATPPVWRLMIVWFLASYLLWFFQFTIYRYLIPLELVAGLFTIRSLNALLRSERIRLALLPILTALLLLTTVPTYWARAPFNLPKDIRHGAEFFTFDRIPPLPDHATVLAIPPIAYVIPYFRRDARFVGTEFVTTSIYHNKGRKENFGGTPSIFERGLFRDIQNHAGPFYILFGIDYEAEADKYLRHYSLTRGRCEIFHNNAIGDQSTMKLCPAS